MHLLIWFPTFLLVLGLTGGSHALLSVHDAPSTASMASTARLGRRSGSSGGGSGRGSSNDHGRGEETLLPSGQVPDSLRFVPRVPAGQGRGSRGRRRRLNMDPSPMQTPDEESSQLIQHAASASASGNTKELPRIMKHVARQGYRGEGRPGEGATGRLAEEARRRDELKSAQSLRTPTAAEQLRRFEAAEKAQLQAEEEKREQERRWQAAEEERLAKKKEKKERQKLHNAEGKQKPAKVLGQKQGQGPPGYPPKGDGVQKDVSMEVEAAAKRLETIRLPRGKT